MGKEWGRSKQEKGQGKNEDGGEGRSPVYCIVWGRGGGGRDDFAHGEVIFNASIPHNTTAWGWAGGKRASPARHIVPILVSAMACVARSRAHLKGLVLTV